MRAYSTSNWFCQKKTPPRWFRGAVHPLVTRKTVVRSNWLSQGTPAYLVIREGTKQLFRSKVDQLTPPTKDALLHKSNVLSMVVWLVSPAKASFMSFSAGAFSGSPHVRQPCWSPKLAVLPVFFSEELSAAQSFVPVQEGMLTELVQKYYDAFCAQRMTK